MATSSDIRKGLCIRYNNDIYKIIEFLHVKPGKGPAFVRTKLKSVTARVTDADNPVNKAKSHKRPKIKNSRSMLPYLLFSSGFKSNEKKKYNIPICKPEIAKMCITPVLL